MHGGASNCLWLRLAAHTRPIWRFRPSLRRFHNHLSASSTPSPAMSPDTPPLTQIGCITLTEQESKIFDILSKCAEHLHHQQPPKDVTLRVAGGWVRDKLLGMESHDIDIALDTMMGYDFALQVNRYLAENGFETHTLGKIDSNPEKSKHLETATTKVMGNFIDFVNLRTESYREDSRIPIVRFGTPLEDAQRRDITINALFYNIQSKQVEDYTGQGLSDLRSGLVRTPLDPIQTFLDDPLRILRVIRFASRFGYQIDTAIAPAAANSDVRSAFGSKLSRERIGTEVDKMMRGPDPLRSLQLVCDFGYYSLVFMPPESVEPVLNGDTALSVAKALKRLLSNAQVLSRIVPEHALPLSEDDHRILYLCASMCPFADQTYTEKAREYPVSKYMAVVSLKLNVHDGDVCHALQGFQPLITKLCRDITPITDRKTIGQLIRNIASKPLGAREVFKPLGPKWPLALIYSLALEISQLGDPADSAHLDNPEVSKTIGNYALFMQNVARYDMEHLHDLKPLLDGKDIARILCIRPGPQVGEYLYRVMEWQLEHPHGTKPECESWIKVEFAEVIEAAQSRPRKKPRRE
ncbi:uncharacterized protein BJ171DRAFT_503798 [Polychytrium aggregatum]|uniref:uncharacterized protein n=1 Tax=Polychytrium aggregatum TaxID=110093 RepID=UPI0022FDB92A|nr:uncharacterized protein BJ171DRAFT_503798 [Polychytrium aggregatum]KAI9204831.1 hypothetical protein BJ171DRAFT_503798 [Polychytrium aggregatum]